MFAERGTNLDEAIAAHPAGAGARARERLLHRQPGLGLLPAGPLSRRPARAEARGEPRQGRPGPLRAPGRRLPQERPRRTRPSRRGRSRSSWIPTAPPPAQVKKKIRTTRENQRRAKGGRPRPSRSSRLAGRCSWPAVAVRLRHRGSAPGAHPPSPRRRARALARIEQHRRSLQRPPLPGRHHASAAATGAAALRRAAAPGRARLAPLRGALALRHAGPDRGRRPESVTLWEVLDNRAYRRPRLARGQPPLARAGPGRRGPGRAARGPRAAAAGPDRRSSCWPPTRSARRSASTGRRRRAAHLVRSRQRPGPTGRVDRQEPGAGDVHADRRRAPPAGLRLETPDGALRCRVAYRDPKMNTGPRPRAADADCPGRR